MMKSMLLGWTLLGVLPLGATASPADLGVGDAAPRIEHVEWLKGQPVPEWQPGHVYVLDFWATWCGPCIQSIPHINDLAAQYEGKVSVIGLAIWPRERMKPTDEYIAERGDEMAYLIAEDIEGQTAEAFMSAAGQNGIPTCMVVNGEGRIAWIGHPMGGLDDVLEQVVAGTWDMEAAKAAAALEEAEARRQAEIQQKAQAIYGEIQTAETAGDFAKAADLAQQIIDLDPMFAGFSINKYRYLLKSKRTDVARAYAEGLVKKTFADNAPFLNGLAWSIATPDNTDADRDFAVALMAARRAAELTESKDADILDTLARVHAGMGHFGEAAKVQAQALAALPEDAAQQTRDSLGATLAEYEAADAAQKAEGGHEHGHGHGGSHDGHDH